MIIITSGRVKSDAGTNAIKKARKFNEIAREANTMLKFVKTGQSVGPRVEARDSQGSLFA
jgi:hypothetical protein